MMDPASGRYFDIEPMHVEAHRNISLYDWNLIEEPREHGKTEQFAIARPLWSLGKNPNKRIKIISNTDGEAQKRVVAIRNHIVDNPRVRDVFPDLQRGDEWTDHKIKVKRSTISKDSSVEGYGVLSAGTGGRADEIIFDDICDLENTLIKPALIDKVIYAYENKWINLLARGGKVTFLFTRWHQRDLSHQLARQAVIDNIMKNTAEKYKYTVHLIDDKLTSISNLWPHDRLKARLNSIRSRAFARGFQGKAMTDDEQLFSMVRTCVDTELSVEEVLSRNYPPYGGVDPGHRRKADRARSAIATIVMDPETKKKYLIDVKAGRWSSPDTAKQISAEHKLYQYRRFNVENNAYQEALLEWIKATDSGDGLRYIIKAFTTGKNKADELLGLPNVALEMENGGLIIPHGGRKFEPSCGCNLCQTINEFLAYPIGEFSDRIMAVWFAMEAARPPKAGIYVL